MNMKVLSLFFLLHIFLTDVAWSRPCSKIQNAKVVALDARPEGLLRNPAYLLAERVSTKFQYVLIDRRRVREVVQILRNQKFPLQIPGWDHPPYLQTESAEEMARYLLLFNSINYSFIDRSSGEHWGLGKVKGSALAAKSLVDNWFELSSLRRLPHLPDSYVQNTLLKGDIAIPLVQQRTDALREVGHFLHRNAHAGVLGWMKSLGTNDAAEIAAKIPTTLATWQDPFLKRAQLFVGMLAGWYQGREDSPFAADSVDHLTIFADYRVPQTFRAMGILRVRKEAKANLQSGIWLEPGSTLEIELRAASILIGQMLVEEMNRVHDSPWGHVTPLHVDYMAWSIGRSLGKGEKIPDIIFYPAREHHTVTTQY
ncbi:MAG: queuosine salvage family protein [Bdellovibrio sp.]